VTVIIGASTAVGRTLDLLIFVQGQSSHGQIFPKVQVGLKIDMRKLWEDRVTYTLILVRAIVTIHRLPMHYRYIEEYNNIFCSDKLLQFFVSLAEL